MSSTTFEFLNRDFLNRTNFSTPGADEVLTTLKVAQILYVIASGFIPKDWELNLLGLDHSNYNLQALDGLPAELHPLEKRLAQFANMTGRVRQYLSGQEKLGNLLYAPNAGVLRQTIANETAQYGPVGNIPFQHQEVNKGSNNFKPAERALMGNIYVSTPQPGKPRRLALIGFFNYQVTANNFNADELLSYKSLCIFLGVSHLTLFSPYGKTDVMPQSDDFIFTQVIDEQILLSSPPYHFQHPYTVLLSPEEKEQLRNNVPPGTQLTVVSRYDPLSIIYNLKVGDILRTIHNYGDVAPYEIAYYQVS